MAFSQLLFCIICLSVIMISAEDIFYPQKKSHLPSEVDWRTKGAVTSVKTQGSCNACWAFASVSAVESHYFIKTGKLIPLSAQNLIDCSNVFGNRGCLKGYPSKTFRYIIANKGINHATSYPYRRIERRCRFDRKDPVVSIHGYVRIQKNSEQGLKEAVATKGPVVVAIYTSSSFLRYNGGVYFERGCEKKRTNHIMLVVGYGTDEDEGDYWILKNSYGTYWGDDGYMKLARNRNESCVASFAFYPLV